MYASVRLGIRASIKEVIHTLKRTIPRESPVASKRSFPPPY